MGYLKNESLQKRNEELKAKFSKTKTNNAIGMYSGGLDSILAALVIKEQGYNVHLVHFVSPFFGKDTGSIKEITAFVEDLGMNFIEYNMPESYINDVLYEPKYGYGKSMNPCIDCHSYMFRLGAQLLVDMPADFIFTGEVMGQRPMSQNKIALHIVETMSGLEGRLLRPLSAQVLPETFVEKEAWVDRNKLLKINGRGRSIQKELAEKYKLKEYPQPAGGCHLTDRALKPRFKALNSLVKANEWDLLKLLRIGRHFLFKEQGLYLVVARDERENLLLDTEEFKRFTIKLEPINFEGAIALVVSDNLYKQGVDTFINKLPKNTADFLENEWIDLFKVFARYTKAYRENSNLDIKVLIEEKFKGIQREIEIKNIAFYQDVDLEKFRV